MEPSDLEKAKIRQAETAAVANVAQYAMWAPESISQHLNSTGYFDIDKGYMGEYTPEDEFL
jgi:hypothetical protein